MQMGDVVMQESLRADAALGTGGKVCTTAGTAEAIGSVTNIRQVMIQSKRANTGQIYIGPSTVANDGSNGIYLDKGDAAIFNCTSLSELYLNSTVNGEGVTYLYW